MTHLRQRQREDLEDGRLIVSDQDTQRPHGVRPRRQLGGWYRPTLCPGAFQRYLPFPRTRPGLWEPERTRRMNAVDELDFRFPGRT